MKTPKDHFLNDLADKYDTKQRIVGVLSNVGELATCTQLETALQEHLAKIQGQINSLEQAFKSIGEKVIVKQCRAAVDLLHWNNEIASFYS